jgi:hypothetical protein
LLFEYGPWNQLVQVLGSGSIHDTAMIMMVISVQMLGSGSIHDTAMIMMVISETRRVF